MNAVDELMERKKNGFDFGILGRAILEFADNLRTTQVAIEQRDMKIGELEERVKALEDLAKRHIRLHIKEELSEPTPAPDLDALVEKYIHTIQENYYISAWSTIDKFDSLDNILRAFAAELVKP